MSLRALGGGELAGDNFLRFVYLDESGVGDPNVEPTLCVGGVIVNADQQLKAVERHLLELVNTYVPPEKQNGFIFHAQEMMNGGGIFVRNEYPQELRLKALEDVCAIPTKFDLPIVFHAVDRKKIIAAHPNDSIGDLNTYCAAACSTACLIEVERYMREEAHSGEVATLVYENTDKARKHIRDVHNYLKTNAASYAAGSPSDWSRYIPVQRIAETAFFAEKSDSSLLQVADAIAYVLNRQFRAVSGTERFISKFRERIIAVKRTASS